MTAQTPKGLSIGKPLARWSSAKTSLVRGLVVKTSPGKPSSTRQVLVRDGLARVLSVMPQSLIAKESMV